MLIRALSSAVHPIGLIGIIVQPTFQDHHRELRAISNNMSHGNA